LKRPDGNYQTLKTEKELSRLVSDCLDHGLFAIDVETTSIHQMTCDLVGISVSCRPGEGYYIPVGHQEGEQLDLEIVRPYVAMLTRDVLLEKIFFNAVFDMTVLSRFGMPVIGNVRDTMIGAWLADNGRHYPDRKWYGFTLAEVVKRDLGFDMVPISDLLGRGKNQITFDKVSIEQATEYAVVDVDMPLRLFQTQDYGSGLDLALTEVLQRVNATGVLMDEKYLRQMSDAIDPAMEKQQAIIDEMAGHSLAVSSYQQLSNFLFVEMELVPDGFNKQNKAGYWSVAGDRLEAIKHQHPIVSQIQHLKALQYIRRNTLKPLLAGIVDGRGHTNFNQMTVTTRLSSSAPNLQNIPTFTVEGYEVRQAFTVPEGCIWLRADYNQVELRVLAHILAILFRDYRYADIFKRGGDIHRATAASVADVSEEQVTKNERRDAKAVNFGLVYGMSPGGLAYQLRISYRAAVEFLEAYFARYPGVRLWMEWQERFANEKGYVETPFFGFRRYVPKGWRTAALNTPVQGGAAEIIKQAMVDIQQELDRRGLRTKMLLQVHDELDFEVPEEELDEVVVLVRDLMEGAVKLEVPLLVDMEVGKNWGQLELI
jgi:DNA polymerase-1